MRLTALPLIGLIVLAFLLQSCDKEVENFETAPLSDYVSLQPGKYFIYRTDSTVFTDLGRTEEVHTYQEKDVVDTIITDNLNRTSYRIYRYLRDTAGTQPWVAAGTYFITPLPTTIEVVENNLRTVRLTLPVTQGTTWKGNRYLPTEPYSGQYSFNNDDNMADWDFTIDSTDQTVTLNGNTYNEVIVVTSADESINVPITDASSYASRTLSVDQYAKSIGLIYQEYTMWEYQPNPGGPSPYKIGFGVKRTLLEHN